MNDEDSVKKRLEFLKKYTYEELNRLKDSISQGKEPSELDFNYARYKFKKHQKIKKWERDVCKKYKTCV